MIEFASSSNLRRHHSLLHSERRSVPASEEVISGTSRPCDPTPGESELGFWEALCATTRVLHHRPSSLQVNCVAYRRLQCRLIRPVFTNVVVNNISSVAATTTNEWYVCRDLIISLIIVVFCMCDVVVLFI